MFAKEHFNLTNRLFQEKIRKIILSLFNLVNPAFRSLFASHLDSRQGFAELSENRTDFLHSGRNHNFCSVVIDATDWRNYRCRSAKTDFNEILKLRFVYGSFFNLNVKIIACNCQK